MDWTTGPLDYFLTNFLIIFWTIFLAFSRPFFGPFYRWLVPREGWDAVYQYSRRDGSQTVVTEGGVKDELSICREGWEVDVLVTATDLWSVYCIIHIILSGFSTHYLYVKILALGRSVSLIFVM